jgi:hypothetical protein
MKNLVSVFFVIAALVLFGCSSTDDGIPAGHVVMHTANTVNFNMHYVPSGGAFSPNQLIINKYCTHRKRCQNFFEFF